MKTKRQLLEAINELTFTIGNRYPELYQFLDESPETLPVQEHPEMNRETFGNYLAGLKQLLRQYEKTHAFHN